MDEPSITTGIAAALEAGIPIDGCPYCPKTAADHLQDASELYRERNKVYGDNYKRVGPIMAQLFPKAIKLQTPEDFNRFHLLELVVVKLTRYCNNWQQGGHEDSIKDLAVYAAMCLEADQLFGGHEDFPKEKIAEQREALEALYDKCKNQNPDLNIGETEEEKDHRNKICEE